MSTTLTPTAKQYDAANKAARTFHAAEAATTKESLTTLVGHAVTLAEALQSIRVALHKSEQLQDAKAKMIGATRFYDVLAGKGDLEVTRADVAFAFAVPTDAAYAPQRSELVRLLTVYMTRCGRRTTDAGQPRTPTLPRWDGFRSFVVENASYKAKHNSDKFDADGDMVPAAKVAADTSAATRETDASTIIATDYATAVRDAHPNDKVAQAVELRCNAHDIAASLAKVMDGMSDADKAAVAKQYKAAVNAAKVLTSAGVKVTA